MQAFDNETVLNAYYSKRAQIEPYLNDLKQIILDSKESLEGNAFYIHNSLDLYDCLLMKQANLYWCGQQAKMRICEIGFNAGHSTLLLLLGRDTTPIDFTIFDIGEHSYTKPSFEYITAKFPHVKFEYIEGDSTKTMPLHGGQYDLVHVDGGHSEYCIENDLKNADRLVVKGGIVIIDDTNASHINKEVDLYISRGDYRELDVLKTMGYCHRIIQKAA